MVTKSPNVWHALGYHAERARSAASGSQELRGGGAPRRGTPPRNGDSNRGRELDALVTSPAGRFAAATAVSLLARTLHRWLGRRSPGLAGLVRGASAGIGAAGILAAVRYAVGLRPPALDDEEPDLLDELLEGAGHGLVYAAVLEPNLPGPAILRGLLLGTAEHLASPWGGVLGPLQVASPHSRVPGLERLLAPMDVGERPVFDHLLFATVLAVLYGSRRRR